MVKGKDETSRICQAQSRFFQIESLRSFSFWRIWSYNILIAAMWNSNHIEKISYGFTGEVWKCLKQNVHLHLSQQRRWTCSCILRCDCQPHLSLSSRDYINSSKQKPVKRLLPTIGSIKEHNFRNIYFLSHSVLQYLGSALFLKGESLLFQRRV